MSESTIQTACDDHIMEIYLNRPAKKNALTHEMYTKLYEAIEAAEQDDDVRVIYISGTEGCFTSGNDLKDFAVNPPQSLDAPVFKFLIALSSAKKPIVAAVSGPAVGIGTTLLLHCDLVYCDSTAVFQLPFVSLGLCPEGGSSVLLPRLAGYQKAAELLLLGKTFSAAKAAEIGLVTDVMPISALQFTSLKRALDLAAQPPEAVRLTKALLKRPAAADIGDTMREEGTHFMQRLTSAEAIEAFTAFAEKRKPNFRKLG